MQESSLIVRGVTEDGRKLRPSDWIERICSSMNAFDQQRCVSSLAKIAQPCIINGEKCLAIPRNLEDKNPPAYEFVMGFVNANRLEIMAVREQVQSE